MTERFLESFFSFFRRDGETTNGRSLIGLLFFRRWYSVFLSSEFFRFMGFVIGIGNSSRAFKRVVG